MYFRAQRWTVTCETYLVEMTLTFASKEVSGFFLTFQKKRWIILKRSRCKLRSVFAWVWNHHWLTQPQILNTCNVYRIENSIIKNVCTWESNLGSETFSHSLFPCGEYDLGTWFSPLAAHCGTAEVHAWCFNSTSPLPLLLPSLLHVSRFGRDSSLHILCSNVSARPAETGEVIWHWCSYSVYKHIITSNTSDQ